MTEVQAQLVTHLDNPASQRVAAHDAATSERASFERANPSKKASPIW